MGIQDSTKVRPVEQTNGSPLFLLGKGELSLRFNSMIIQTIFDQLKVTRIVQDYFKGDSTKTTIWLNTENPYLDGREPIEIIYQGKTEYLLKVLKTVLKQE